MINHLTTWSLVFFWGLRTTSSRWRASLEAMQVTTAQGYSTWTSKKWFNLHIWFLFFKTFAKRHEAGITGMCTHRCHAQSQPESPSPKQGTDALAIHQKMALLACQCNGGTATQVGRYTTHYMWDMPIRACIASNSAHWSFGLWWLCQCFELKMSLRTTSDEVLRAFHALALQAPQSSSMSLLWQRQRKMELAPKSKCDNMIWSHMGLNATDTQS